MTSIYQFRDVAQPARVLSIFTGAGGRLGPASGGGNEDGRDGGVEGVDAGVKPEGRDTSANRFRRIKGKCTARGQSKQLRAPFQCMYCPWTKMRPSFKKVGITSLDTVLIFGER